MIGIYLLKQNGIVVYVGQSINIEKRIRQHGSEKDFNSFEAIECTKENLNSLEAHYILLHNPVLNKLKYEITIQSTYYKKVWEKVEAISIEKCSIMKTNKDGSINLIPLVSVDEFPSDTQSYYIEALQIFSVCNSNKDNLIVTYLVNHITRQMTLTATTKKIADTFKVSEVKVRALIKRLKNIDFLRGSKGVYLANPFMWIPNGVRDDILASAQSEWTANTEV